jgi:hypothetical protein
MESSNYYLIGFGVSILISLLGTRLAVRRKRLKLQEGLGREVKDEDITSISAWMKADDRVVNEVINDNSLQNKVEDLMEDAVSHYPTGRE